jgi:POT family proton-dependent oligopeptide transporter
MTNTIDETAVENQPEISTHENVKSKDFLGHPRGLFNLFSTEFCERFSYYGMRAILVYYVYATVTDGGLGLTKQDALYVMTLFGSLVYLLSVVGGWISDRILGSYRSVFIGGVIIACGHIILSIPNNGVVGSFAALGLIVVGTGLLKPNVSTMVGDLYQPGDRRINSGFNIFVMGINSGAFISPMIVGSVQKATSYHLAFLIPAVFMFIALGVFVTLTRKTVAEIALHPPHPLLPEERKKYAIIFTALVVVIVGSALLLGTLGLLTLDLMSIIMPVAALIIVVYLFATMFADKTLTKEETNHVKAYVAVFVAAAIFWGIEELQSSVFAVLAESRADNHIGSFEVPEAWYQSINPLVIIALAPIMAVVWHRFKRQPSVMPKMLIGLVLTGLSFVIPAVGFMSVGAGESISPLLIVLPIALFSFAELFVSPIGLSATTQLAPRKYSSRLMALWFLSNSLVQGVNAFSMRFFDENNPSNFFLGYVLAVAVIVIVIGVLLKPLKRLMHPVI